MMTLKYPALAVRSQNLCREASLFTLPPQGVASISDTDAQALDIFRQALRERLSGPVSMTTHPHRIGNSTSVALHLEGRLGQCIDVLITVTGNTLWPQRRRNIAIHSGTSTFWIRPMWCICCCI